MEAKPQYSTCIICKELFIPNPKVGSRQNACFKRNCQLERKRRNQKAWLASHPDYFKGRYPQLKEQILKNRKKPTTEQKHSGRKPVDSIQDELTINHNNLLRLLDKTLCIQDELRPLITTIKQQIPLTLKTVYKSN